MTESAFVIVRRRAVTTALIAAAALLPVTAPAGARVALAQEAPDSGPPPGGDAPPPAVDLGPVLAAVGGLRDGFAQLPERIASALWAYTGGLALKSLAAVVGFLVATVRWLAHGALGDVNFFTQIPEPWVTLSALDAMRARLVPVAVALGGLAGALVLLRWIAGLAFGWAFPGWAFALVKIAALVPLVGAAPAAMLAVIRAGNTLAGALFDPAAGLPGLAAVPDPSTYDRLAAEGIAALVYFGVCLWLWWVRVQVVLAALLLFVTAPLAVACWVLPFGLPQWVARTWATLFVGTVAVQVLQALTLGIGAGLVAANVVTGEAEGVGAGVVNLGLAAGLVAATCYVPRRVLGALVAHAPPGLGWLETGLRAGLILAGTGWLPGMAVPAAATLRAHVVGQRTVPTPQTPGPPPAVGRVGSLVGGQRPLLPPPRD
jgi:hypothetical protein